MNQFNNLFFIILLFCAVNVSGQIGIRLHHQNLNARSWEALADMSPNDPTYASSVFGVGLDYWFRLENYRIEFFPEIGFTTHTAFKQSAQNLTYTSYYGRVNTHFYVLDFEADCNCPTFSNQSPWFSKGFFLMAAAGAAMQNYPVSNAFPEGSSQVVFQAGIGAGIDIGIIDLITLTPYVTYLYHITPNWEGLASTLQIETESSREKSNMTSLQAGLRVGFRF
ncbi:MAG: hypothetical protein IPI60_09240 [Saprospiraceae bacterium]|nr:hypothetical protein [Saprospiraceae bacterium]